MPNYHWLPFLLCFIHRRARLVKSHGDFQQLLLVRIDENFTFTGKLFNRNELAGGAGKFLRARLREGIDEP